MKIGIILKDYFPKLKKIRLDNYDCIISNDKIRKNISLKEKENEVFNHKEKMVNSDLTYLISLIDNEYKSVISKSNLVIPYFRIKQLQNIKKIKYEQQIKMELNKEKREILFGNGVNVGSVFLKFIIDISISDLNNINSNILKYQKENSNIINSDLNLNNLSLSSYLTNLSTLKENKINQDNKIEKKLYISNNNPLFRLNYLYSETSPNIRKNSNRKIKKSQNTLIKNKTKFHINREYLKSDKNIDMNCKRKYINTSIETRMKSKDKARKARSNANLRIKTESDNFDNHKYNNKKKEIKSEIIKKKTVNKLKKDIKIIEKKKKISKTRNEKQFEYKKGEGKSQNIKENKLKSFNKINPKKEDNIFINENFFIKNDFMKQYQAKWNNIKNIINKGASNYLLVKEKTIEQHKVKNLLQNEFEKKDIKNFIHVNINKKSNNFILSKMTKIKEKEINIYKIILNDKLINKKPNSIIKEKQKQQKQMILLINIIRNLIKIFGNLSHIYNNNDNKKILSKSLFLTYNIKEKEWNENDNLLDIYENMIKEKEKKINCHLNEKEKKEFTTIKEEEEEQEEEINTIE